MKKIIFMVISIIIMLTSAFAQTPNNAGPIAGTTSVCAGSSAMYAVAPVNGATSYMWTLPAGATITSGFATNQITVQFGTSSGDIMVFGQNGTSFGNGSSFPVIVNAAPSINITATPADICAGSTTTLTATSATATSYAWSGGGNNSTKSITPSTTTSYTCTVSNGVCSNVGSITVNVHPAPNASLNLTVDKACHDVASLQLTGGSPLGGTYSSSGSNIIYENNIVYPPTNEPGTWTITYTVTDAYGCTGSASDLFTINPIPAIMFNNIGGSLTVNSPDVNLNNYVMPQGGTFTGDGTTAGSSIFSFKNAGAGTHMLTYTYVHPITGCTASQIQYVTIAQADSTGNGNGNGTDAINEATNSLNNIRIYPNPTNSSVHIASKNVNSIQLFELTGKLVYSGVESTIDISSFQTGIYTIKITSEDGNVFHSKVIKQ